MKLVLATPMEMQMIHIVEQTEGEPDEHRRMTHDFYALRGVYGTAEGGVNMWYYNKYNCKKQHERLFSFIWEMTTTVTLCQLVKMI